MKLLCVGLLSVFGGFVVISAGGVGACGRTYLIWFPAGGSLKPEQPSPLTLDCHFKWYFLATVVWSVITL